MLVLDSCEHVIDACAQLADGLLRSARKLCVLATSRESLGINGEMIFRVPPLSVPDIDGPTNVTSLATPEAVELFVDRARSVKPTFAVNHTNATSVRELCHRLEGIPLAIGWPRLASGPVGSADCRAAGRPTEPADGWQPNGVAALSGARGCGLIGATTS